MLWELDHAAAAGLADQIRACVRRGVATGELQPGEVLPTSGELARLLDVNPNTVLAAYRALRDDGLLEFRRGRSVRVAATLDPDARLLEMAREFARVAAEHGLGPDDAADVVRRAGVRP